MKYLICALFSFTVSGLAASVTVAGSQIPPVSISLAFAAFTVGLLTVYVRQTKRCVLPILLAALQLAVAGEAYVRLAYSLTSP